MFNYYFSIPIAVSLFSYGSVFQPFSSRGTFETILSIWLHLDTQNSTYMSILRELGKELAARNLWVPRNPS